MSNKRLSAKQRKFIDAYLGEAKYNATKAAIIAGYKPNGRTIRTVASENLTKPNIQAEIAAHFQATAMTRDETIQRLAEQARSEHNEYIDEYGRVDIARLKKDGKGHLIKNIIPTKYGNRVEFHDGQSALALIAKHHGLLSDKIDIKLETTLTTLLDKLEQRLDKETYNHVLSVIAEIS